MRYQNESNISLVYIIVERIAKGEVVLCAEGLIKYANKWGRQDAFQVLTLQTFLSIQQIVIIINF